jgi:hypothetical protein
MSFKKGDKVKRIVDHWLMPVGTICVIKDIDEDGYLILEEYEDTLPWKQEKFELVEVANEDDNQPLYDIMTVMPLLDYVRKNASKDDEARKALYAWDEAREKMKNKQK